MNSLLLSDGKFFLICLLVLSGLSCGHTYTAVDDGSDEEISLKQDQQDIEELRKNIPSEIRHRNDMLKVILESMGQIKDRPSRVRQKFNREVRKRRSAFQKNQHRQREKYNKNERRQREAFLKQLKKERDNFRSHKATKEQRSDFYNRQDQKRRDYFANQRDKRREFDSDAREKSNDFYADTRAMEREFSQEWRIYNRKWRDLQKQKELERKQRLKGIKGVSSQDASGFEQMQQVPGTHLGTDSQ